VAHPDIRAVAGKCSTALSSCGRRAHCYSALLPPGTSVQAKVYSAYVEIWYQPGRADQVAGSVGWFDGAGAMPCTRALAGPLRPVRVLLKEREGKQAAMRAMIDVLQLDRELWRGTSAALTLIRITTPNAPTNDLTT
jgi:hypothetical protein